MAACGSAALVGREVTVFGLASRADLNGRAGVVSDLTVTKGRYLVALTRTDTDPGETIAVKPTNLRLASALTGSVVRLHDLKADPSLNGRRGKCVRYAADRGRFEVLLTPVEGEKAGTRAERTVFVRAGNLKPYESSAKGHDGTCMHCGAIPAKKKDLKYCSSCLSVAYCGHECMKASWKAHKPVCKVRTAALVRVNIEEAKASLGGNIVTSVGMRTMKMMVGGLGVETESKKGFTIKVQIPMTGRPLTAASASTSGSNVHMVMCYNEKRDVNVVVLAAMASQFDALCKAVETLGLRMHGSPLGVKAYFPARLIDDGKVLLIDVHAAVEPPPPW